MASLVMVASGANVWTMKNAKPHPTGFWAEEFVTPHRKFTEGNLYTGPSPNPPIESAQAGKTRVHAGARRRHICR